MRLIKELRDLEVIGKTISKSKEDYKIRIAARAILFDSDNKIAILSIPKFGYHKLPGGGLEKKEKTEEALRREIKEEVGCEIDIIREVGEIIEFKNEYNEKQTSYGYLAKIKGLKGKNSFTKEEKNSGFILTWIPIEKAINLIENDAPREYTAKFIRLRDFTFLLEAKRLLK